MTTRATFNVHVLTMGAVAKWVEHGPHVQEIGSLVPSRVKLMTQTIDMCLIVDISVD